jgi:hypothetical protein
MEDAFMPHEISRKFKEKLLKAFINIFTLSNLN